MKKTILTAAILCGVALLGKVNAQQVSVGVKGGVNIAGISKFSDDPRIGANVGVFAHTQLSPNFCLQPEVLYSWQGGRFNTINGERTLALNYIQVPVMLQYFPIKQFYLEAGPQVSFLTNADIKYPDNGKEGVSSAYKKADFAVNVGAGLNLTHNVGVFARYNIGVTDITASNSTTQRNQVGQLGAYVRLGHN